VNKKIVREVVRNHPRHRLKDMKRPSEETYWSAKEWAMRTRIPYRAILAAAARGELVAVRPSGRPHGVILISESSWAAWMQASRLQVRIPGRVPTRTPLRADRRTLQELALD
jgi:hypothetical protein